MSDCRADGSDCVVDCLKCDADDKIFDADSSECDADDKIFDADGSESDADDIFLTRTARNITRTVRITMWSRKFITSIDLFVINLYYNRLYIKQYHTMTKTILINMTNILYAIK